MTPGRSTLGYLIHCPISRAKVKFIGLAGLSGMCPWRRRNTTIQKAVILKHIVIPKWDTTNCQMATVKWGLWDLREWRKEISIRTGADQSMVVTDILGDFTKVFSPRKSHQNISAQPAEKELVSTQMGVGRKV